MEAIFLSPKCYSLLMSTGNKTHKRAKGVHRCVVLKEIPHQDYIDLWVYETDTPLYFNMHGFKSKSHVISTIENTIVAVLSL